MPSNVVPISGGPSPSPQDLKVKISTSSGHQGRVANKEWTWKALCDRLSNTAWDTVTLKEYLSKPIDWQDKRKNQGYFVGGQFQGGIRKLSALSDRSMLTFDVDNCSPGLLAEVTTGLGAIGDYEYVVYSTRKHTAEKPRIRIVLPTVRPTSKDRFGAVTRIISHWLDDKMEAVDPVCFRPAQIMYWPSTCRGADFVFHHNEGILIDSEAVLNSFGDWTDYSKLPRSPREKDLRAAAEKVEDPKLKRGIVGAFNRHYDIHAAIETFLSDVYEVGETGTDGVERYSFIGGSTTNGAVVYDGGMQLYSYHSTDPCSDRLVNPFDMVRIHKFGHLDTGGETVGGDGEPLKVTDLPSYKEMQVYLASDKGVMGELREDNYDTDAMADDFEAEEEPTAIFMDPESTPAPLLPVVVDSFTLPDPADEWEDGLDITEKGIVKSNLHNISLILENDSRFRGCVRFNQFIQEPVVVKRVRSKSLGYDSGPVRDRESGDMIGAAISAVVRSIMEAPRGNGKAGWGLKVSDRDLKDAMIGVAGKFPFHPVQRYLRSCKWDGVPRIDTWLINFLNAADTPLNRAIGRKFLVAAVMRVFEPGSKFDFVLVLEGLTGIQKSSAVSVLAGHSRFGELNASFDDPAKIIEETQGKWILELAEMTQFSKANADIQAEKKFLSNRSMKVRLAWGRGAQEYPRQFVLVGTTNLKEYLKDPTGNRRFWGVALPPKQIDLAALAAFVDLLWAEAYQVYLFMRRQLPDLRMFLPLYMDTKELKHDAEEVQAARMVVDEDEILVGQIEHFLETPVRKAESVCGYRHADDQDDISEQPIDTFRDRTCVKDIAHFVFGKADSDNDKRLANAIGRAMSRVSGWEKHKNSIRLGSALGKQRVYDRILGSGTDL